MHDFFVIVCEISFTFALFKFGTYKCWTKDSSRYIMILVQWLLYITRKTTFTQNNSNIHRRLF